MGQTEKYFMIHALQKRLHWRKEVESGLSPIVWFKLNLASRVIDDLVKLTEKLLGL
ncbi:MAG: hypothetical protein ABTQ25_20650 [Nitrosomonas ureae]